MINEVIRQYFSLLQVEFSPLVHHIFSPGKELHLAATLPFGWERSTDDKGRVIFIDEINNRTTCVDPRIAHALTAKKKAGKPKFDSDSTALAVLHGKDLGRISYESALFWPHS